MSIQYSAQCIVCAMAGPCRLAALHDHYVLVLDVCQHSRGPFTQTNTPTYGRRRWGRQHQTEGHKIAACLLDSISSTIQQACCACLLHFRRLLSGCTSVRAASKACSRWAALRAGCTTVLGLSHPTSSPCWHLLHCLVAARLLHGYPQQQTASAHQLLHPCSEAAPAQDKERCSRRTAVPSSSHTPANTLQPAEDECNQAAE